MPGRNRSDAYFGPKDGSVRELAALVACLDGRSRTDSFTRLAALFGEDFAPFLAVFQGEVLAVPSRSYVERMAFYCKVYVKVSDLGGGPDAVSAAASEFDLPEDRVVAVCGRVSELMDRRKSQCRR